MQISYLPYLVQNLILFFVLYQKFKYQPLNMNICEVCRHINIILIIVFSLLTQPNQTHLISYSQVMTSDRPAKEQWSPGHSGWGESSSFRNGQTNSNSWGASISSNTGHVTTGQGHSTTGQMGVQWNSRNSQNQARWWSSRHGQRATNKGDRKVIFLIFSII